MNIIMDGPAGGRGGGNSLVSPPPPPPLDPPLELVLYDLECVISHRMRFILFQFSTNSVYIFRDKWFQNDEEGTMRRVRCCFLSCFYVTTRVLSYPFKALNMHAN